MNVQLLHILTVSMELTTPNVGTPTKNAIKSKPFIWKLLFTLILFTD